MNVNIFLKHVYHSLSALITIATLNLKSKSYFTLIGFFWPDILDRHHIAPFGVRVS